MKITLGVLRALIREQVERNNRWTAGMFMAGGEHGAHRDKETSLVNPPPGLGTNSEEEKEKDEQEKPSQWAARVWKRSGGAPGSN